MTSLRDIAAELDTRGIRTPRGGNWSAQQVSLVEKRAARLGQRGLPIST